MQTVLTATAENYISVKVFKIGFRVSKKVLYLVLSDKPKLICRKIFFQIQSKKEVLYATCIAIFILDKKKNSF